MESFVRECKKKCNIENVNAAKEKREVLKLIPKYSSQTGRPLFLTDLNSMVQTKIKQLSNRGHVNRAIANATPQALLIRSRNLFGEIVVCFSFWVQGLFQIMNFKNR